MKWSTVFCETGRMKGLLAGMVMGLMWVLGVGSHPAEAVERRKDQFPTESSYLIFPLPFSVPGIGEGVFMPINLNNLGGTTADAYFVGVFGDFSGTYISMEEVPLFTRHIWLKAETARVRGLSFNAYPTRGMDSDGKDGTTIVFSEFVYQGGEIKLQSAQRQLEYSAQIANEIATVDKVLDLEGNLLYKVTPRQKNETARIVHTLRMDNTDDYQDPRAGLRLISSYTNVPAETLDDPDFFTVTTSAQAYLPLGKNSTLAINFMRSDAHVRRKGLTDLATIKATDGIDCTIAPDPVVCAVDEDAQARNTQNANAHGSSLPLGGLNYMRAYPEGRFKGAHTGYFSLEFRINFTEGFTPFDYWVWKDVKTGLQLALFYEVGSVSELSGDLWKQKREDYGAGFRMVAASGVVYRADLAVGDEGAAPTIMVMYPW